MSDKPACYGRHTKHDGSWWQYDARGIPTGRVCAKCEKARERTYAPAMDPSYTLVDEPIDED